MLSNIISMLAQCWASAADGGPTVIQLLLNDLCLLSIGGNYAERILVYVDSFFFSRSSNNSNNISF